MWIKSLMLCIGLTLQAAAAEEVRLDARLQPESDIRAGQPLYYEIDVLTDTWLTGTPDFSRFQVPGTLITFEGSQGRTIQRNIEGKRYFGLSYRYRLIPLESGVTTLPGLQLEVPVGQSDKPVAVTLPARSFAVQPLPAAEAAGISLLATDIQLSQSLRPATLSIQTGQPLIREIRVQAQGALALSIPRPQALAKPSPAGTELPAEVKALTDQRGHSIGGERIEQVRYLPEETGTLTLPAVELAWWDIDEGKVKRTRLPELVVEVTAAETSLNEQLALAGQRLAHQVSRRFPGSWAGLAVTLALVFWALRRYRRSALGLFRVQFGRLHQHWRDSRFGTRHQAVRELKKTPAELTSTYRLIQTRYCSPSIRNAPLDPESQQNLLDGLAHYYGPSPDPTKGQPKMLRALRRLIIPKRSQE
ncbi:hypothetical protein GCM10009104_12660 [Marinobacterium maritimum]|uniref:Oxygen tolerance n=2 Tax=Marinobacterium maritimum TaxID=500162 RepID=A0ABN1I4E5_9GAMM